jgi:hypothetical protein
MILDIARTNDLRGLEHKATSQSIDSRLLPRNPKLLIDVDVYVEPSTTRKKATQKGASEVLSCVPMKSNELIDLRGTWKEVICFWPCIGQRLGRYNSYLPTYSRVGKPKDFNLDAAWTFERVSPVFVWSDPTARDNSTSQRFVSSSVSHARAGRPTLNSNAQINGKWKFLELLLALFG